MSDLVFDDNIFSVLVLCVPRCELHSIARISICSKQLAQLCSAHLTAGNQQQAARLLLQAVRDAANDAAKTQALNRGPWPDQLDRFGILHISKKFSPVADPQQQKQHISPIRWLLSAVDCTVLLNAKTPVSHQLVTQLAILPNVPAAVAGPLVVAGLHVSCSHIVEAATAGPLPDAVAVWLQPCDLWLHREGWSPLAKAVAIMLDEWSGSQSAVQSVTVEELLTKLNAEDLVSAALVAINAPEANQEEANSAIVEYRNLPAAQDIGGADLAKLLSAVVDRLLQEPQPRLVPFSHGHLCLHGLCALPAARDLPQDTLTNLIARAIDANNVNVLRQLCGDCGVEGRGCWILDNVFSTWAGLLRGPLARRYQLPVERLSPAAVQKLMLLAAATPADQNFHKVRQREMLGVLSRLPGSVDLRPVGPDAAV